MEEQIQSNLDEHTVAGFGAEWERFDQSNLSLPEAKKIFDAYFSLVDWSKLPEHSVAMDIGCGSGRWAVLVADRVSELHLVDASPLALGIAARNLASKDNCVFHHASVDSLPMEDASVDLVYSLGVLHHVPETASAIASAVQKLRPGGVFLVYLYYRFDNRPLWFKALWRLSDLIRRPLSSAPFKVRAVSADLLAVLVYVPLVSIARFLERKGKNVSSFPLSSYRDKSFYTLRTDALDRFGTKLEQRFTKKEISEMLLDAGLTDIEFRQSAPFWCAVGRRQK